MVLGLLSAVGWVQLSTVALCTVLLRSCDAWCCVTKVLCSAGTVAFWTALLSAGAIMLSNVMLGTCMLGIVLIGNAVFGSVKLSAVLHRHCHVGWAGGLVDGLVGRWAGGQVGLWIGNLVGWVPMTMIDDRD